MELNYNQIYYEMNREKILENHQKYYQKHMEQCKEYQQMYYQTHKDYYNKHSKQYYQEHKEYFKKLNNERYYKYKQEGLLEKYKNSDAPKIPKPPKPPKPNVVPKIIEPKKKYSYRNYKKNKIENDLKKNAEKAEQFKMQLLNQSVSPNNL
jgi:hypothetical protein